MCRHAWARFRCGLECLGNIIECPAKIAANSKDFKCEVETKSIDDLDEICRKCDLASFNNEQVDNPHNLPTHVYSSSSSSAGSRPSSPRPKTDPFYRVILGLDENLDDGYNNGQTELRAWLERHPEMKEAEMRRQGNSLNRNFEILDEFAERQGIVPNAAAMRYIEEWARPPRPVLSPEAKLDMARRRRNQLAQQLAHAEYAFKQEMEKNGLDAADCPAPVFSLEKIQRRSQMSAEEDEKLREQYAQRIYKRYRVANMGSQTTAGPSVATHEGNTQANSSTLHDNEGSGAAADGDAIPEQTDEQEEDPAYYSATETDFVALENRI